MDKFNLSEIKARYILAVEALGSLMMERPELIGYQDYKPLIDTLEDIPALIGEVARLNDLLEGAAGVTKGVMMVVFEQEQTIKALKGNDDA